MIQSSIGCQNRRELWQVPVMLLVVFCYTLCSLNDKYAVSRCLYDRHELMFLMASGTVVFLGCTLPFYDLSFEWSPRILIPLSP